MRHINRSEFWENVKKHIGEAKYSEIKKKFEEHTKPQTAENIRLLIYNELIPIMMEAARINGCKNAESERLYQIEALRIFLEFVRKFPQILSNPESITEGQNAKLKEEIYPQYAEISRRFAEKHLCHSHPRDGFTCYCSEKN
jgi:hypothetical protein